MRWAPGACACSGRHGCGRAVVIDAAVLPDGPLVVGGDLNTWHGRDEPPRGFSDSGFRPDAAAVERVASGLRVLDYMFVPCRRGQRARYRQIERRTDRTIVRWWDGWNESQNWKIGELVECGMLLDEEGRFSNP